ncbi:MAG: hypothetical protein P8M80_18090 [Pirellulaceae bacterium]|nr:hypothetical protein [Pirellulaceae bacterium]
MASKLVGSVRFEQDVGSDRGKIGSESKKGFLGPATDPGTGFPRFNEIFFSPQRETVTKGAGGIFFGGKMRLTAMALGVLCCLHGVGKYRRSAASDLLGSGH